MQGLLELLLLLQVPEDLPTDSLQALHLPLALVHLTFQGLHPQRQLGMERGGGEHRRSQVKTWTKGVWGRMGWVTGVQFSRGVASF